MPRLDGRSEVGYCTATLAVETPSFCNTLMRAIETMNCNDGITDVVPGSKEPGLFESDTYQSPERSFSVLEKLFMWNRLYFYTKLTKVVAKGAKMAKTGNYTRQGWFDLSLELFQIIKGQGGRISVSGLDNIRKHDGPVVYVSNHMSMLETVLFPCLLLKKSDLCITLKKQLSELPLFGTLVGGFRSICVTRAKPMEDYKTVIREGSTALKEGYSVLIFPQSTRTVDFKPEEFNTVGAKLARKAGVPIVPVAIRTDFWKTGKLVKDLGPFDRSCPIHFQFADPVAIESRNGKEENDVAVQFIKSRLNEWQS